MSKWVVSSAHLSARFVRTPKHNAIVVADARQAVRAAMFAAATCPDLVRKAGLQASAAVAQQHLRAVVAATWDESKFVRDASGRFTFKNGPKGGSGGGKGGKGGGGGSSSKKADAEAKKAAREKARAEVDAEKEADRQQRAEEDAAERQRDENRRRSEALAAEQQRRERAAEDERHQQEASRIADAAKRLADQGDPARGLAAMEKLLQRARDANDQAAVEMLTKDLDKLRADAEKYATEKSKNAADKDTLNALRDRVKASRRAEDEVAKQRQFDAREAEKARDVLRAEERRRRQEALRVRWKAMMDAVKGSAGLRASGSFSKAIIALLPEGDREVTYPDGDICPIHLTLAFLGDVENLTEGDRVALRGLVRYLARSFAPFTAEKNSDANFGENGEVPVALYQADELQKMRDYVMSSNVRKIIDDAATFPTWFPHIADVTDDTITFDRVGLWIGSHRENFDLTPDSQTSRLLDA